MPEFTSGPRYLDLFSTIPRQSRNGRDQDKLKNTKKHLIIIDETRKLSADYFRTKIIKTKKPIKKLA